MLITRYSPGASSLSARITSGTTWPSAPGPAVSLGRASGGRSALFAGNFVFFFVSEKPVFIFIGSRPVG